MPSAASGEPGRRRWPPERWPRVAAPLGSAARGRVWALSGPLCGFNDTWQLTINTGTTIITFLMVFVIQSSQNRDTAALQIKLDELIHVIAEADDRLLDLEELDEATLEDRRQHFEELAERARRQVP